MGDDALLADRWHGDPPEAWRDRWGIPALRIYTRVGSTNDVARDLAEEGAPAGTTVLADAQIRGRGRRGREWLDSPGRSLLLSVVLRPDPDGAADDPAAALPLLAGLAAARAVERVTGVALGLKWPNDLLIRGRKVGGVLCEGASEGGRRVHVVVGIGINALRQDHAGAPDGGATTSLEAEGGRVSIPALVGAVLREVLRVGWTSEIPPDSLREIRERDVLSGQEVTVDGRAAGRGRGIDRHGALLVERGGRTHRIISGTVRTAGTGPQHSDQT